MNIDYNYAKNWLEKLKTYWINKDIDKATSLFKSTTYYQETPFMKTYTTFNEIAREWQHIEKQNVIRIEFKILALENNVLIVNWLFEEGIKIFDGIYEIKFNDKLECIFLKSWEMKKWK